MVLRPLPPGGLPRLSFEASQQTGPAPLRTDIAIFVGATPRGPVGEPVRIDGMPGYEEVFGGMSADGNMGHALHGYFENGGRLAWVVRLAPGALAARETWTLADGGFLPESFQADAYDIAAATPGMWGNDLRITSIWRQREGRAFVDLDIALDGRPAERLSALPPERLTEVVAERSALIRLTTIGAAPPPAASGPRQRRWEPVALSSGSDGAAPGRLDYEALLPLTVETVEPALLIFPDLHRHLRQNDAAAVLLGAARLADGNLDRMVIADAPEAIQSETDAQEWLARLGNDPAVHRTVATYHPWIDIRDPVGTPLDPLKRMPPSGHVAGAISRMDRDLGAYVTPANTSLAEAIDLARRPPREAADALSTLGFNALRCQSARGIVVWGGRMLRTDDAPARYVAHRRLIHRLVRGLRQVWAPRVFETNDAQLRLAVARSATTLLLEAFHSNVLKGTRPDEAFQVTVDDSLNTPEVIEAGRLICEIAIAPAVPMEFIHFRIGLNPDGQVELIEP